MLVEHCFYLLSTKCGCFVWFQSFGVKAQSIFNENLSQNKQLKNEKLPTVVCIFQVFVTAYQQLLAFIRNLSG